MGYCSERKLVSTSEFIYYAQKFTGNQRESEILKCPWHQWEFDIKTGQALYDEKLRVKTYRVAQEGDEVVLYL